MNGSELNETSPSNVMVIKTISVNVGTCRHTCHLTLRRKGFINHNGNTGTVNLADLRPWSWCPNSDTCGMKRVSRYNQERHD